MGSPKKSSCRVTRSGFLCSKFNSYLIQHNSDELKGVAKIPSNLGLIEQTEIHCNLNRYAWRTQARMAHASRLGQNKL